MAQSFFSLAAWPAGYGIRDLVGADYPEIVALNRDFEHFLSPMDAARLAAIHRSAAYARVVIHQGSVAAFLLALREGTGYDSPNYKWFSARSASFLYIDRIVVRADHQGQRLGRGLYADLFAAATAARVPRVTCEFDTDPPSEASRRFHAGFGFREVGTQVIHPGGKTVSLQEARLWYPGAGQKGDAD